MRLYYARDLLPPAAAERSVRGEPGTAAERIRARLDGLNPANVTDPPPAGAFNAFPLSDPSLLRVEAVTVDGDTARVDFRLPASGWAASGAARSQGLLQQLVYTATEEPGIRRVLITENGGRPARIDQIAVDGALAREDVFGYAPARPGDRIESTGDAIAARATVTHSVDAVAPAMARVVVRLEPVTGTFGPLGYLPSFTAEAMPNDDRARPELGKYVLELRLDGIENAAAGTVTVDGSPLRAIQTVAPAGARAPTIYRLGLDDLRPWRVTVLAEPVRVVVDVGGHPQAVAGNTAVYAPRFGETVARDFTVSGLARAFEANVLWRVRDSADRVVANGNTTASIGTSAVWGTYQFPVRLPASVSGNVTLEVFQSSPRDGSETDKVAVPLQVR
ncbi:MAG: Gmad2 immunoglobulin-like domain-containing protein, partial [Candidatus Limnocylindria bacterium]